MMKLYIEIENGVTKNHPATEENLIQAFGEIPARWEPFTRVVRPQLGVYEVLDSQESIYAKVDGVWSDVWLLREMTPEEKLAKQQAAKAAFLMRDQAENWSAWTIDEETCFMRAPIPLPPPDQTKLDAGIWTAWCGAENNWKDTPVRPKDGKQYKFDFFAWQWIEVTQP